MSTKTNNTVSAINNNKGESNMTNLLISVSGRSTIITLAKVNSRNLYKALRDEKFLPAESVSKTSSETSEDGKAIVVSYKNIEIEVQLLEESVEAEETFLEATPEQQAKIPGRNFGVTSSFGIVSKGEIFFMEYDEEGDKSKMVGAETHTASYLAQLEKREKRRAYLFAKSQELFKTTVVKDLKKLNIDVESLDQELINLIAEQALDLEAAPNAPLKKDDQEVIKVQIQRLNEESGRWYNAKNRDGSLMVDYFPAEAIFDINENGHITGIRMTDFGQTLLAHTIEEDFGITCVHAYNYTDRMTGEVVSKVVQQRFMVSGMIINSNAVINEEQLPVTEANTAWKVFPKISLAPISFDVASLADVTFRRSTFYRVIPSFEFNGYNEIVDIGEGFYLVPSAADVTGADNEETQYQNGIITGRAVATSTMALNNEAKIHVKANRDEEAELNKVATQARRQAQTKKDLKTEKAKNVKESDLYKWAVEIQESTFKARKDASLQVELNEKFKAMADQADDLIEVLEVLKEETGQGFAYPSFQLISSLSKKPKNDSNKAFRETVEQHIIENIEFINKGEFNYEGTGVEVLKEILVTCRRAKAAKADLYIKNAKNYFKLENMVNEALGIKKSVAKVSNGKVRKVL